MKRSPLLLLPAFLLFAFASPGLRADSPVHWQDEVAYLPAPVYGTVVVPASERALFYPNRLPASRVPYRTADGSLYFYDFINRPYPFTPEPIWRTMFMGMRDRIALEEHTLGVPGQAAREYLYYRSFLALDPGDAAVRKAEAAARKAEEAAQRAIDAAIERADRRALEEESK